MFNFLFMILYSVEEWRQIVIIKLFRYFLDIGFFMKLLVSLNVLLMFFVFLIVSIFFRYILSYFGYIGYIFMFYDKVEK